MLASTSLSVTERLVEEGLHVILIPFSLVYLKLLKPLTKTFALHELSQYRRPRGAKGRFERLETPAEFAAGAIRAGDVGREAGLRPPLSSLSIIKDTGR